MAQLDAALGELEAILTRNDVPDASKPAELAKFIVASRAKTIATIAEVVQLSSTDARLKAQPEFEREFAQKLQALRRDAAGLQAKWRSDAIEQDHDAYGRESREHARSWVDFCRWARGALQR